MRLEWQREDYLISTDKARLDLNIIHGFLVTSYWAEGRFKEAVEKSVAGSLCFGVFKSDAQAGFARVITDYATLAYLADVFVLEPHRGRGLGRWLVETVLTYPPLQTCGWTLFTKDAHDLYRRFGFDPSTAPERLMRRQALRDKPL
ncbi:MAG: GNAT family N-acetyltransferase [Deinococcota bacterium]|nr:GNAT family N-acetyltransferase [Deinococcota bacterium]